MGKGNLSIHTENIFPIIKKWLYSEQEIFLRELVSNAVDAITKLKILVSKGTFQGSSEDLAIKVHFDEKNKTITVSDNGIGMTQEEVEKYINQIAFSGAEEFLSKIKDNEKDTGIIGHFGLGFYSSFMVSSKVEIHTLSYQKDAKAAWWTCEGQTEFEMKDSDKKERGTDVILSINDDSKEYLSALKISEILNKYCRFLPVPVFFENKQINNVQPAWTKKPTDLKDEDYISLHKELYLMAPDPLFWIHLNVDHPFKLTGVLYFPKIKNEMELHKNKIQLYCNQVFVTDSVQDVVPDFLMLLQGVLDSPDIPLNVSRSFLQNDPNVKKINSHIAKKTAEKLDELFRKDRKSFEEKWEYLAVFVKYGMITNEKFYEKAASFCLLNNLEKQFFTISEYKEKVKILQTDKDKNLIVLYSNQPDYQDSFIQSAKKRGYDVLLFNHPIDSHFIGLIEGKEEKLKMVRVDSGSVDKLIDKGETQVRLMSDLEETTIKEFVTKVINDSSLEVLVSPLSTDEPPMSIVQPEFMRRFKEMSAMGGYGMMGNMPEKYQLLLNVNHPVVYKISKEEDADNKTKKIQQLYDLALLAQNMLKGEKMTGFIQRSMDMMN